MYSIQGAIPKRYLEPAYFLWTSLDRESLFWKTQVLQKSKRVRGSDIDLQFEGLQFESSTPQIPFEIALEWIPAIRSCSFQKWQNWQKCGHGYWDSCRYLWRPMTPRAIRMKIDGDAGWKFSRQIFCLGRFLGLQNWLWNSRWYSKDVSKSYIYIE